VDWAQLHHDVCFGKSGGRIIWQPRIGCWYQDKVRAGQKLPEPYDGMELPDIFRALGVSDRLYGVFNPCFQMHEDPRVRDTCETGSDGVVTHMIHTPVGKQVSRYVPVPEHGYPRHMKRIIETEGEMKVAIWRLENASWQWDQALYERRLAACGDLGAPTIYLPRVNVQDLYINTMGVENATYAMIDFPDTVEAYFRALHDNHDRLIDLVIDSPIDIINYGDNLHAGTLPPNLYEKYVLPEYHHRGERLRGAGKFVHSHWDGDTGPLLKFAKCSSLDGIEAITPKPQGDVTLEQVTDALGDEVFLLDGIPAVYFDTTFPVSVLEECTHKLIELFAPKLILGISDELSSTGDIERIRVVAEIVNEYNAACG
jgi:hypothetical protein